MQLKFFYKLNIYREDKFSQNFDCMDLKIFMRKLKVNVLTIFIDLSRYEIFTINSYSLN